jgi:hypothetical protein
MAKYRSRIKRDWTFANIRLTKEQRKEFTEWGVQLTDNVVDVLTSVLLEDYKFSLRFDSENDAWIATLTGTEGNRINPNTSMSGRHNDAESAIMVLLFKHLEVCGGETWETEAEDENWG